MYLMKNKQNMIIITEWQCYSSGLRKAEQDHVWNSRICRCKKCTAILANSLTKLEYRGHDSAGIAVFEGDRIKTVKAKGKLKEGLIEKLENEPHSQLRQV